MLVNFRIGFILYVFEQILIHICRLVQVFAHISALRASTENPKVSFQVPFPVPVLILQNSGGLAARNKIRDTSEISINDLLEKSIFFLLKVGLELWYYSQPFFKSLFHKMTLLSKDIFWHPRNFWNIASSFAARKQKHGFFKST